MKYFVMFPNHAITTIVSRTLNTQLQDEKEKRFT